MSIDPRMLGLGDTTSTLQNLRDQTTAQKPGFLDRLLNAFSSYGQSTMSYGYGYNNQMYQPQPSQGIFGLPTWLVLGGGALVVYTIMKRKGKR